ncbi:MAG: hypothetical protein ACOYVF_03165 [Candidatus Zixiibacteriota bacterium]
MKHPVCIISLILVLILSGPVAASGYLKLAGEINLPMPDNWLLASDSPDYPFQLVDSNLTSEILIFKSDIAPNEVIANEVELQEAVDRVIEDVILSLPEASLLTNTGYYEKYRTVFILEFSSLDTVNLVTLRHRFEGLIYRLPEGGQVLFTLWAKATDDNYASLEASIKMIQEGFNYSGPQESNVFGRSESIPIQYIIVIVLILGLFFLLRLRRRGQGDLSSRDEKFWRCPGCGRLNPLTEKNCRRCGLTFTEYEKD